MILDDVCERLDQVIYFLRIVALSTCLIWGCFTWRMILFAKNSKSLWALLILFLPVSVNAADPEFLESFVLYAGDSELLFTQHSQTDEGVRIYTFYDSAEAQHDIYLWYSRQTLNRTFRLYKDGAEVYVNIWPASSYPTWFSHAVVEALPSFGYSIFPATITLYDETRTPEVFVGGNQKIVNGSKAVDYVSETSVIQLRHSEGSSNRFFVLPDGSTVIWGDSEDSHWFPVGVKQKLSDLNYYKSLDDLPPVDEPPEPEKKSELSRWSDVLSGAVTAITLGFCGAVGVAAGGVVSYQLIGAAMKWMTLFSLVAFVVSTPVYADECEHSVYIPSVEKTVPKRYHTQLDNVPDEEYYNVLVMGYLPDWIESSPANAAWKSPLVLGCRVDIYVDESNKLAAQFFRDGYGQVTYQSSATFEAINFCVPITLNKISGPSGFQASILLTPENVDSNCDCEADPDPDPDPPVVPIPADPPELPDDWEPKKPEIKLSGRGKIIRKKWNKGNKGFGNALSFSSMVIYPPRGGGLLEPIVRWANEINGPETPPFFGDPTDSSNPDTVEQWNDLGYDMIDNAPDALPNGPKPKPDGGSYDPPAAPPPATNGTAGKPASWPDSFFISLPNGYGRVDMVFEPKILCYVDAGSYGTDSISTRPNYFRIWRESPNDLVNGGRWYFAAGKPISLHRKVLLSAIATKPSELPLLAHGILYNLEHTIPTTMPQTKRMFHPVANDPIDLVFITGDKGRWHYQSENGFRLIYDYGPQSQKGWYLRVVQ